MQKLIFRNSLKEIDLTSGNFGVTNWEGLSGVDLDIQTQTVPFVDGSVYLDSLLENRDLNFTVAIYDGNDLALRYELKRKLISALNPKLGEGELFYTNDFISVKIKAVPHVPIFENKNSNNSGTLKVNVTFTACNPYWEDVATKEYLINNGEIVNIENDGDAEVNLKAIFLTGNVTNPSIKNLTTGKEIKINGTFSNSVLIDTEFGNKGLSQDVFSLIADNLTETITIKNVVPFKNKLFCLLTHGAFNSGFILDGNNSITPLNFKVTGNTEMFVAGNAIYLDDNYVHLYSLDGVNWLSVQHSFDHICYYNNKYFFNHYTQIYVSDTPDLADAINLYNTNGAFTKIYTTGTFLIGLDTNQYFISEDGITWDGVDYGMDYFLPDYIVEAENRLYLLTDSNVYFIDDMNFVDPRKEIKDIRGAYYSPNEHLLYIKTGGDDSNPTPYATYKFKGANYSQFTPQLWDGSIDCFGFIGSNQIYFKTSSNVLHIYMSSDGNQFFELPIKKYYTDTFLSVSVNDNIYLGVSSSFGMLISKDGLNWSNYNLSNGYNTVVFNGWIVTQYRDDTAMICATIDGQTARTITVPFPNFECKQLAVNNELLAVCGDDASIAVTSDLENFELWETSLDYIDHLIYFNGVWIVSGDDPQHNRVFFGSGNNWTAIPEFTHENDRILNLCIHNDKLIIFYTDDSLIHAKYSTNLINWFDCDFEHSGIETFMYTWEYKNAIFVISSSGEVFKSADGVTWSSFGFTLQGGVGFTNRNGEMIIPGSIGTLHMVKTGEINVINHLTENSDMSFNFVEGNNAVMFSYDSGYATAKIEFNKRYIGV